MIFFFLLCLHTVCNNVTGTFLSGMKFKNIPLDAWSTRERLALACSVMRNGDNNWYVLL